MNNEKGFTLLESLIAMGIFAVAILGYISLQFNSIQIDGETTRKDSAVQLLNTTTELVEFSDFDDDTFFQPQFQKDVSLMDFGSIVVKSPTAIPLATTYDSKARVFMRFRESGPSASVRLKTVYLVAAWNGVKSNDMHILTRVVMKPDNFMQ